MNVFRFFFFSLIFSPYISFCNIFYLLFVSSVGFFRSQNHGIGCPTGYSVRQWSWSPGFNPRSRHTKHFKNGTLHTYIYIVSKVGDRSRC